MNPDFTIQKATAQDAPEIAMMAGELSRDQIEMGMIFIIT